MDKHSKNDLQDDNLRLIPFNPKNQLITKQDIINQI